MSITILLAGEHAGQRQTLRRLLSFEPDMAVVGEAGSAESALMDAQALGPDMLSR